jgi:hypothetical protein
MNKKYFFDTETNKDKSLRLKAIAFANSIAEQDEAIKRIVLYLATKNNIGWFDGIFTKRQIKQLFNGCCFNNIKVPIKIETEATYKKCFGSNDIVICYGTRSKGLYLLEDNICVKYMISIPWLKEETEEWIKSRNAINVETGESSHIGNPTPVVIVALNELTKSINLSTGIIHPMDNELAKTYIRVLHKYEKGLDGNVVSAYLVNSLHWEARHAQDIKMLIERLNEGRTFRGGAKVGHNQIYKHWQDIVSEK